MLPVLFELQLPGSLAPFKVSAFGFLLALGLAAGALAALAFRRRSGLSRRDGVALLVFMGLSALLGGRLVYVVTSAEPVPNVAMLLSLGQGGLSAYGALAGALLFLRLRARPARLLGELDFFATAAAGTLLFGKLGCYLYGCDFGRPLHAGAPFWQQKLGTFPRWLDESLGAGPPAWWQAVKEAELSPLIDVAPAVHPVQLYEAALGGLLFFVVARLRVRAVPLGTAFLVFVWGYGTLRAVSELFRGDLDRGSVASNLPLAAVAAVTLFLIGTASAFGPPGWWLDARMRAVHSGALSAERARVAGYLVKAGSVLLLTSGALLVRGEERIAVSVSLALGVATALTVALGAKSGARRALSLG